MGTWAGAIATALVVITTALVALGYFDGFRGPRLRLTFEATEPWCRQGKTEGDGTALWVRVGVENLGGGPARGCLGRLISVATNGESRPDVDPVQLRWAGVPRSRAFEPMDLRRDQREYLNRAVPGRWAARGMTRSCGWGLEMGARRTFPDDKSWKRRRGERRRGRNAAC